MIGHLVVALIGLAVSLSVTPFAVMCGWNWLIAGWADLPQMPFRVAFGAVLVIGLLTFQHIPRTDEQQLEMYGYEIALPFVALIVLAVAKGFAR